MKGKIFYKRRDYEAVADAPQIKTYLGGKVSIIKSIR